MATIRHRQRGPRDGNASDPPDLGERPLRPVRERDSEELALSGAVDRDVIGTHRVKRRRKLEQVRGRASGVRDGGYRVRIVCRDGLEVGPEQARTIPV